MTVFEQDQDNEVFSSREQEEEAQEESSDERREAVVSEYHNNRNNHHPGDDVAPVCNVNGTDQQKHQPQPNKETAASVAVFDEDSGLQQSSSPQFTAVPIAPDDNDNDATAVALKEYTSSNPPVSYDNVGMEPVHHEGKHEDGSVQQSSSLSRDSVVGGCHPLARSVEPSTTTITTSATAIMTRSQPLAETLSPPVPTRLNRETVGLSSSTTTTDLAPLPNASTSSNENENVNRDGTLDVAEVEADDEPLRTTTPPPWLREYSSRSWNGSASTELRSSETIFIRRQNGIHDDGNNNNDDDLIRPNGLDRSRPLDDDHDDDLFVHPDHRRRRSWIALLCIPFMFVFSIFLIFMMLIFMGLPFALFLISLLSAYYCCTSDPLPPRVLLRALMDNDDWNATMGAANGFPGGYGSGGLHRRFTSKQEIDKELIQRMCFGSIRVHLSSSCSFDQTATIGQCLKSGVDRTHSGRVHWRYELDNSNDNDHYYECFVFSAPLSSGNDEDDSSTGNNIHNNNNNNNMNNSNGGVCTLIKNSKVDDAKVRKELKEFETLASSSFFSGGDPLQRRASGDFVDVELAQSAAAVTNTTATTTTDVPTATTTTTTTAGGGENLDDADNSSVRQRGTVCDICLLDFEAGDIVAWSTNPRCDHAYHSDCICDWLMRQPTCPSCRQEYLPLVPPSSSSDDANDLEQDDGDDIINVDDDDIDIVDDEEEEEEEGEDDDESDVFSSLSSSAAELEETESTSPSFTNNSGRMLQASYTATTTSTNESPCRDDEEMGVVASSSSSSSSSSSPVPPVATDPPAPSLETTISGNNHCNDDDHRSMGVGNCRGQLPSPIEIDSSNVVLQQSDGDDKYTEDEPKK